MGGGRDAPNPSNEVDIYDPVANSWSVGTPFVEARRNFPTDTNGTDHIWLAGGYGPTVYILDSMEIFTCPVSPCGSPSPTPTALLQRRRLLLPRRRGLLLHHGRVPHRRLGRSASGSQ